MLTLCTVGHIIYDDPYHGWVLQDEAMFDQVQLKALAPGLYEGMTPSKRRENGIRSLIHLLRTDVIHEEDAELINSKWPYSSATSLATIRDCIRSRPSVCIRKRNVRSQSASTPLALCDEALSFIHHISLIVLGRR